MPNKQKIVILLKTIQYFKTCVHVLCHKEISENRLQIEILVVTFSVYTSVKLEINTLDI